MNMPAMHGRIVRSLVTGVAWLRALRASDNAGNPPAPYPLHREGNADNSATAEYHGSNMLDVGSVEGGVLSSYRLSDGTTRLVQTTIVSGKVQDVCILPPVDSRSSR